MRPEFKQAKEIFLAAVEKAQPEEREAYLRAACGADTALRKQVDGLLRRHEDAGSFLEHPFANESSTGSLLVDPAHEATRGTTLAIESVGTKIGPYKLVQQL